MKRLSVLCIISIFFALLVSAQQVPRPVSYVRDEASVFSRGTIAEITAINRFLKEKTGAEIAIYTLAAFDEGDLFTFGVRVFDAWKPGDARKSNGLLIIMSLNPKEIRVITGRGLEGALPDGKVGRVIDEVAIPFFQQNKYEEGLWALTYVFAQEIAKEYGVELTLTAPAGMQESQERETPGFLVIILVGLWILLYAFPPTRPLAVMLLFIFFSGGGNSRGRSGGGFSGRSFGGFGGGSTAGGGAGRRW